MGKLTPLKDLLVDVPPKPLCLLWMHNSRQMMVAIPWFKRLPSKIRNRFQKVRLWRERVLRVQPLYSAKSPAGTGANSVCGKHEDPVLTACFSWGGPSHLRPYERPKRTVWMFNIFGRVKDLIIAALAVAIPVIYVFARQRQSSV